MPAPTVPAGTPGSSSGSGGARDCQEKPSRCGWGRVKFSMGCCDALRIAGGTGSRRGDEQHRAVGLRASPAAIRAASPASLTRRSGHLPFAPPEKGGEQPRLRDAGRQSDRNPSLRSEEALPLPLLHCFPARLFPLAQNSPFPSIVLRVFPLASFFRPSLARFSANLIP